MIDVPLLELGGPMKKPPTSSQSTQRYLPLRSFGRDSRNRQVRLSRYGRVSASTSFPPRCR